MSSPQPTPTDDSQTEGRATPHDSTSQETHTQESEPIPQGEQDGESEPVSEDLVNVAILCRLTPDEVQTLYAALLNVADPEAAELEGIIPHFIYWTSDRDGGSEALYQRRHEPEERFYVDRAGVADCTLIITENYESSLIVEPSFRDELWSLLKDTRDDYDDYDDVDDGLLDAIALEALEHCVIYGRIPCGGFRSAWANLSIGNQGLSETVGMYGGEVEMWRAATWNMETFYREGERKFREAGGILYQEIMDHMGSDEEEAEEKAEETAIST
ncbi:hypothetical protein AYO20_01594 [Fonsecaea nubica]|uniref:Uncharacterized protein n=1 Tax=Fonsecaea nubica TaxID=856822 RepID=A0A178DBY0_9EURO|nr:hypothetical protein AYO20_01594 [Fonsecaea nubica]OAL39276.1 hypothetical protein AYO20_01594 [Fonsecaea nubica]